MKKLFAVFLVALMPFFAPAMANAAEAKPQQVVQDGLNSLTERLLKEKAQIKSNPALLNSIVEQNITPYVDVDGISRSVMGQFYRQASAEQRARFAKVFKDSLVRTYANGLGNYEGQQVTFKPFKAGKDPKRAQVDFDVRGTSGTIYPMTFQMAQDAKGEWKVRNLILNGINLGLTFRNQFASQVEANRGNLDKAIAGWSPNANVVESAKGGNK